MTTTPRQDDVEGGPFVRSASSSIYMALADAVADPLIVVDGRQRIVVFNRAAERVFGYSAEEALHQHLNLLLPERHHVEHERQVAQFRARAQGHVLPSGIRARVRGRRKDGSTFPAEVSLSTLEVGEELLSAAALRDVSAQVEMERALAASERRFRVIFEESPVAMVLVRMDGAFISGNNAFANQTGYSLDDMAGGLMQEIIVPDDRQTLDDALAPVLAKEQDTARLELRITRRDGSLMTIDLLLAPVGDDSDAPDYLIGQATDVTDRIESRDRLQELVQSKDDLIASISHELRTPLTSLVGFSQLLHEEGSSLSPGERAEMIESIVAESVDLTNIVDDLLVAAKAETGALSVAEVPVDLRAQVAQILESWSGREAETIELVGAGAAVGDPARIRQILRNLVSNAFRYGSGSVKIEISDGTGTTILRVLDQGEEIDADDRVRIFEPYQRAHDAEGVTASMGLGLSISRQLARLMGGDLTYRRSADANVFELVLPIAGAL